MKAIIENGGLPVDFLRSTKFVTKPDLIKLKVFNMYLNVIGAMLDNDVEELRKEINHLETDISRDGVINPFTSGFSSDGFGVYLFDKRVIFVECETDIEL